VLGAVTLAPLGGVPLRVPWSVSLAGSVDLVGAVELAPPRFRPSDAAPAVLSLDAGRVVRRVEGDAVQPVARLEVELWTGDGRRRIGVLARQRNVLPGRYAFGLTGRGPNGGVLRAGRWLLRVVAYATGGGERSIETVRMTILD
jgi:hypothetical protein